MICILYFPCKHTYSSVHYTSTHPPLVIYPLVSPTHLYTSPPLYLPFPPLYNTSPRSTTTDGDGHQAAGATAEPGQGGSDCRGGHSVGAEGTGDGGTTEKKVWACVYDCHIVYMIIFTLYLNILTLSCLMHGNIHVCKRI